LEDCVASVGRAQLALKTADHLDVLRNGLLERLQLFLLGKLLFAGLFLEGVSLGSEMGRLCGERERLRLHPLGLLGRQLGGKFGLQCLELCVPLRVGLLGRFQLALELVVVAQDCGKLLLQRFDRGRSLAGNQLLRRAQIGVFRLQLLDKFLKRSLVLRKGLLVPLEFFSLGSQRLVL